MKVKLSENAILPTRAHDTDAGMDLYTPRDITLLPFSSTVVDTGVAVQLPKGCAGMLVSKSGLNVNFDITSTGLIDEGYSGNIIVKLYNQGPDRQWFHAGSKISQLVVIPVRYEPIEVVDEIEEGERGADGFGSTGR